MAVLSNVAPCSLIEIGKCFGGAYCLHHQGLTLVVKGTDLKTESCEVESGEPSGTGPVFNPLKPIGKYMYHLL
jgi:hypothetical protein